MSAHAVLMSMRMKEADEAVPRFLFRGFNKRSGGNSKLNTPTAITPHAFYGKPKYTRDDGWVAATRTRIFGRRREFSPPKPVHMDEMSSERLMNEIDDHLRGKKNAKSHFSSWTADLHIAMGFAGDGLSSHIGVLDTQIRHDENVIMHVDALYQVSFSTWAYPFEYLVYGVVQGGSYTCMDLAWRIHPLDLCFDLWTMLSPKTTLAHIFRARDRAGRHSFHRAEDTWLGIRLSSCPDPALYLTVIAAEWSRSKENANAKFSMFKTHYTGTVGFGEEMQVVSNLAWLIERAASNPNLVLPLVNSATYKFDLPRIALMVRLLECMQREIQQLRSRPRPQPPSLIGYFWP